MLILYGIIRITGYLSNDLYCLAFQHDFSMTRQRHGTDGK